MKFYDRENEICEIQTIRSQAFSDHSRFTVITGRRRIGKTSLIFKALEKENPVYLFVGKKSEALLCREFAEEITKKLGIFVPDEIISLSSLFRYLTETAGNRKIDLIIDEFQEFNNINSSIYSDIQKLWDMHKETTHINLITSGSVYTLMHEIFQNNKEPLFGRADSIMRIAPFSTQTLKQILGDYAPGYKNEDLLALFAITGGVPKYAELLADNNALTVKKMAEYITRENAVFIDEGRNLLIEEFGKNYTTYFSILGAISSGINTQSGIEAAIGGISIGGYLKRLLEDYNIIERFRPVFSKERTQSIRYEIKDQFLKFWFRFFEKNRSMIEIGNFSLLKDYVIRNLPDYTGHALEWYFKQKLAESGEYIQIGSWWELNKNQNQIDIVAIRPDKKADVIEVKRNKHRFMKNEFEAKVKHLKDKVLSNYEIDSYCLSIDDM